VFASKHLWVTPHSDDQKYPAGEHVLQSRECLGLGKWATGDTPLLGRDPVLWHSFGAPGPGPQRGCRAQGWRASCTALQYGAALPSLNPTRSLARQA
jgi:hypothetical protein